MDSREIGSDRRRKSRDEVVYLYICVVESRQAAVEPINFAVLAVVTPGTVPAEGRQVRGGVILMC